MPTPFTYCLNFDPLNKTSLGDANQIFGHLRISPGGVVPDTWGSYASQLNSSNISAVAQYRGDVPSNWIIRPSFNRDHFNEFLQLQIRVASGFTGYSPSVWNPTNQTVELASTSTWYGSAGGRNILKKSFWIEFARNWAKIKSDYFNDEIIEDDLMESFEEHWFDETSNEDLQPSKHQYWNHTNAGFNANFRNLVFPFRALSNADELYVQHHRGGWFDLEYSSNSEFRELASELPVFSGSEDFCGSGGKRLTGFTNRLNYGISTWTIPIIGENPPKRQFGVGAGVGVNVVSSGELSSNSGLFFRLFAVNLEEDISLDDILNPSLTNASKLVLISSAGANNYSALSTAANNTFISFPDVSSSIDFSQYTHYMFALLPAVSLSGTTTYEGRQVTSTVQYASPTVGDHAGFTARMVLHGNHETLSDWPLSYRAGYSTPGQPMVFSDWTDPANWNWES